MTAIKDIDELASLEIGWDGYKGLPPSEKALEAVKGIQIVPTPDGGVVACVKCEAIMIYFDKDGNLEECSIDYSKDI